MIQNSQNILSVPLTFITKQDYVTLSKEMVWAELIIIVQDDGMWRGKQL